MSEKLRLQWHGFNDNAITAFPSLREEKDFADVTLACEDGKQVEAHKVILAASSPFFQRLLGRNKHPNPMIYMRGMKSVDLMAIVDFVYRGEANVEQENLHSFLAVAEELQLKGLMGLKTDEKDDQKYQPPKNLRHERSPNKMYENQTPRREFTEDEPNGTMTVTNDPSVNLEELDARVMSMIEKSSNKLPSRKGRADVCKVCGKEGERTQIKDHIEANHLEGILFPCNNCGKSLRSRSALRVHTRKHEI